MKIATLTAIAIFVLFSVEPCLAKRKIRLGVSTPITGPASSVGNDVKNVLLFAAEKTAPGKYEFVIEDDKCNPKEAVHIAQKFTKIDKVDFVVGLPCSGTVLSTAPIYEKSKTLVMSAVASAPAISDSGEFIFRTRPSDVLAGKLLFDYMQDRHSVIATLTEQTDYAVATTDAVIRNNSEGSLEIVGESFNTEDADLKAQLLRLREKQPGGLLLSTQSEAAFVRTLKQIRELQWKVAVYGSMIPGSKTFLNLAGRNADGVTFVTLPLIEETLSEEGKQLFREFRSKYGGLQSVDYVFPTTWAAFTSLHQAIETGGDPRDALYSLTFEGLFGKYKFDKNGDIVGFQYVLKTIKDGSVVPVSS